jgi:RHS repeat-associated protein
MHDRLGSVRKVVNTDNTPVAMYTYSPFGELIYDYGDYDQPLRFTAQYYDEEISQYHLRARTYDPHLSRFTSRDPILGKFEEPLTLHKYLYCGNDPLNRLDPFGTDYVDFNVTYTNTGLLAGGAYGATFGNIWGAVLGVAYGGLGFTGGAMTEAGITHKADRMGAIHPYFGMAWSASPLPSVTSSLTYSTQSLPSKADGTTGWQIAATFSSPMGPIFQAGMDISTRGTFTERGVGNGTSYVPLSFSVFYVFDDFTYGDSDLDKAVMLSEMLSDEPNLLGLQLRNLMMAGFLDDDVHGSVLGGAFNR